MIEYYKSIDDLLLYNWLQYSKIKDNKWFIIGYSSTNTYKDIDEEYLNKLEEILVDEYFIAMDDRKFRNKLIKIAQIEHLKLKYNYIWAVLERMWLGFTAEQSDARMVFIKILESLGYKIGYMNSLEEDYYDIHRVSNEVEGIRNKIQLLTDEIKTEYGDEDASTSIHKQLIQTSRILELGYRIDPKEITVAEWVQYMKLVDERIKEQEKMEKNGK